MRVHLNNILMDFSFFKNNLVINIFLLIIFILLIFLFAFFSTTEAAFMSSNSLRLKIFLEEKKKGAKKAVLISEKLDYVLVSIIIFRNLCLILATVIISYFTYNIYPAFLMSSLITILIIGLIFIIFGEFLPKQKALNEPEKIALKNSNIIYIFYKIIFPLTFILFRIKKIFIKNSETLNLPKVTEEELESIIDTMETEGVFDEEDAELIQSAIGLSERTVYDIMTPRVDVIAIEENLSVEEIKEVFFENQFSRIPVFKEDKDNIIGVLSEKDFFTALLKNQNIELEKLISKPIFVSEATKANDLIKELQKLKKHLAIVVDEYGGTSGIVTMEDALEELVGEIYDEYDEEELAEIAKIQDNLYHLSPEMELDDLFEYLDIGLAPITQYNTVGGFVYSLIGGLPVQGMVLNYQSFKDNNEEKLKFDLEFTLKTVENKRIRSIELKVNETAEKTESVINEEND